MPVDSRKVEGRRAVRFASFDEVLAEADRLAAAPQARTLGNWPLGVLLAHLAKAIDYSLCGRPFRAVWWVALIGPWLKRRYLTRGVPAGFRLSGERETAAFPQATTAEGLLELRQAVGRAKVGTMAVPHPVFGKLTHAEWTLLHLRHAELHLSYVVDG